MMTLEKEQQKTRYNQDFDVPLPSNKKEFTDQELIEIRSGFPGQEKETPFRFFQDREFYASIAWENGKYKVTRLVKKFISPAGVRVTENLEQVHISIAVKALNVYFGGQEKKYTDIIDDMKRSENAPPLEDYSLSMYYKEKELFYWIWRITDNMTTSNHDTSRTVTKFEANFGIDGQFSDDINNNTLIRSLDSDIIPFHAFRIKYNDIEKALQSLSFKYYMHLHMWFFDHGQLIIPVESQKEWSEILQQEYLDFRRFKNKKGGYRKKQRERNYKRALRMKFKALEMLRLMIIEVMDMPKS